MLIFTNQTLYEITESLKDQNLQINEQVSFEVLNPDIDTSKYAGEKIVIDDQEYIYRSYKAWIDLAEVLYCRMLTPKYINESKVVLTFEKIDYKDSFHKSGDDLEKYGVESTFANIHKNEEPAFFHYYLQALNNVDIEKRVRILNLGVNSADEFELIQKHVSNFENLELVGIDYCPSAIEDAKIKFPYENVKFYNHDINDLDSLNLGEFDLIITIGTLQSSNIDFKLTFMSLVQKYLKKEGAFILGFPNCRWIDGQMLYGAKMKNYSFSDMSLLYKDVHFCKKYLQQKKFKVHITGKNYIFLTATSLKG